MSTRIVTTKHIAQSATTFVGRDGELIIDDVNNTLKISDGTTAGGVTLNSNPLFIQLPVYSSTSARDTAIPSPQAGMMVITVLAPTTVKVQAYILGDWENVGP